MVEQASTPKQFHAHVALSVARRIVDELRSASERIEIVGSLRRQKAAVHDIDIVLIPRAAPEQLTLRAADELENSLRRLVERGNLTPVRGKDKIKCFIATKTGVPVDIYIATPPTWATLLLIRTGSKEHNIKLAQRARQLGMKLRASGDGIEDSDGNLVGIYSEEDIFSLLQTPYVPPSERS